MMLDFLRKKKDPAIELQKKDQELTSQEMILRNPSEAEQDAQFREQKEKMVLYRKWTQDMDSKCRTNFQYISGYIITDKGLSKDTFRRELCNLHGAYEINHTLTHQDRNTMNGVFTSDSDRNRYIKHNIAYPIMNNIFENNDDYNIRGADFRQVVMNTINPIDNVTRRALNNGERRVDMQVIKTHELSTPLKEEKKQTFMGVPIK